MSHELLATLERAATACDEIGRTQLQRVRERLALGTPRVLLVGEAKRGKSTLGNALLRRELLPSGVLPVTAIATTIEQGSPEELTVQFQDGICVHMGVEALADFVTEDANPVNRRNVATVRVTLDEVLAGQAALVDTPGVGSVLAHNTSQAQDAMSAMDLALFVLTADPPISQTELDLLAKVREFAVATYVVLNKVDRLSPEELVQARDFVSSVTGEEHVFSCSARDALAARLADDDEGFERSGVATLLTKLQTRLQEQGRQDLHHSLSLTARRVLSAAIDRLRVTEAAARALAQSRRDDVDLFARELDGETFGAARSQALVAWEMKRARADLDEEAARRTSVLRAHVLQEVESLVETRAAEPVDAVAAEGQQLLAEVIGRAVTEWHQQRIGLLQDSMAMLTTQLQDDLDRVAAGVEESARRLLGVSVHAHLEPIGVPALRGFRLDFSPDVGWNTAMVAQVRRHLPTPVRRRRMVRDLRGEAKDQAAKHMGRARSDLQSRLEAATRQLHREVESRLGEQREGLRAALSAAHEIERDARSHHSEHVAALHDRITALETARSELPPPGTSNGEHGAITATTAPNPSA